MKKFLMIVVTLTVCGFSVIAQSQSGGTISGKLLDKDQGEPVALANIRVLQRTDSAFVTGKATNNDGYFSIPVRNGSYILHISSVGYHDVYRDVQVTSSQSNVQLGDILLSNDNILLSEAIVSAKAPEITVKGDTLEYNADSYKVTESAVVEDLLKKMPGVEVDSDGKITVNGKQITKILVDGEEFFSDDPKVASKNLPARMVDKLQILERRTEQSQMTGFDDGEEENVINLTVRPGMKQGLFANAFAGYGSQDRYEANAMVNYMKDKDQYTFLGRINNTNNAGFSDLATSMFSGGGMGGMGGGRMGGGRMGGFGGNSGISTSGNIGGNFSKQFTPQLKLGGNIRYGSTDNNVNSDVLTEQILSTGNTIESEKNRSNSISQNMGTDLRLEWEPNEKTRVIVRPAFSYYTNERNETGVFNTKT